LENAPSTTEISAGTFNKWDRIAANMFFVTSHVLLDGRKE
jgi:hypothetical protein